VKYFEEHCNLKFFKKKGRKIYLTDEGKALYDYAHSIFEYEKEIENAIKEMRQLKKGILRKKSLTPNILMETSNTEFIKQLVQRGDGISFLVKAAVTTELKEKNWLLSPLMVKRSFSM